MAKAGNLKLDFVAKSIGIHFFGFEDILRCYRDTKTKKNLLTVWTLNGEREKFRCNVDSTQRGFNELKGLLLNITVLHLGNTFWFP